MIKLIQHAAREIYLAAPNNGEVSNQRHEKTRRPHRPHSMMFHLELQRAWMGLACGFRMVSVCFSRLSGQDDVWMILDGEMTQHRRAFLAAGEEACERCETENQCRATIVHF